MRIYLVGGAVRDRLLGHEAKDRDFVVVGATMDEFLAAHPRAKIVGRKELTCIWRGEEYTVPNLTDIRDDLATRDLTINALAMDEEGNVLAVPGGLDDLKNRVLRPVAAENFVSDPHRVYRAARFHACFPEYSIAPELPELMREIAARGLLETIAAERVGMETLKACGCPAPGNYLRLLSETASLAQWLPELDRGGAYVNSAAADMDLLAGDDLNVWMSLCRRLGRDTAYSLGRRLKLPNRYVRAGQSAHRIADAARYFDLPPEDKVDLLMHLRLTGLTRRMAELARVFEGVEIYDRLERDTETIWAVKLPKDACNLGPASARILRSLRAEALDKE